MPPLRLVTTWPADIRLSELKALIQEPWTQSGHFALTSVPASQSDMLARNCRAAFHQGAADGITLGWSRVPRVKAVFFDMDATVIAEESLVELAAYAGQSEAVSRITARAMAGELEFKDALQARVALIKGLSVEALDKVLARLTLNPGITAFVAACKKRSIPTYMVSGGFTQFAASVQKEVGFVATRTNILGIEDGRLTGELVGAIIDAQGKKDFLLETCAKLGIKPEEVAAVGDGANDIPMLHAAGVAVGYKPKKVLIDHIHAMNGGGDHRFLEVLLLGPEA